MQEFELIARLCAKLPKSRRTILGVGDDCAIIAPGRSRQLITIDSMVEGVHFKRAWTTPELLGARALTVNLSDIAAMGGIPTIAVVNLAVSRGLGYRFFDRLYAGLRRAAAEAKVDIVGGNVTRATELSITIALIGSVAGGVMRRDAARAGDAIYVTGTLGDAALGLRILQGDLTVRGSSRAFLVNRYLAPTARLVAGRTLARLRPAPAAIDISDGFWQDLGHILAASQVGADVVAEALPLSPAYRAATADDLRAALTGGDDYELLFCAPPKNSAAALGRRLGVPVAEVGRVVKRRGARLFANGRLIAESLDGGLARTLDRQLNLAGWDQLRNGRG